MVDRHLDRAGVDQSNWRARVRQEDAVSWRTSGSRSLQTLATVPMLLDQLLDQAGPHMVRQSVMVHILSQAGGLSPSLLEDFPHLYWRTITIYIGGLSTSILNDYHHLYWRTITI